MAKKKYIVGVTKDVSIIDANTALSNHFVEKAIEIGFIPERLYHYLPARTPNGDQTFSKSPSRW